MGLPDSPPPYRTLAFDCDSTLSAIEGIEELAGMAHGPELARLTRDAMDGLVPLEEVYGRRLDRVRPSRAEVERIGRLYVERRVPGVELLFAALRALEKRVVIVSGGLLPAVRELARFLGVAPADVHAVDVAFDDAGGYAGFDRASPLARGGGKPKLLRELAHPRPIALVGDGATDLEAAPVVDRFVAFGGVARREAVFGAAAVRCDAPDLGALAPLLLSAEELERLRGASPFAPLFHAAQVHRNRTA